MIKNEENKNVNSPYIKLYDLVILKNHPLRRINDLVDFSFVNDELEKNYNLTFGRPGFPPIMLFKYLYLKILYNLSDVDVVERSLTDLSFKYFLGLEPESPVIDPSTLTKFRKLRIKDDSILNMLIKKSIEVAKENGIKISNKIIVDSTHTSSIYNPISSKDNLLNIAKILRKKVYNVNASFKDKMPEKTTNNDYEEVINYCQKIIDVVKAQESLIIRQDIIQSVNLLQELITDTNEHLVSLKDCDAKIGHKTADTEFYGYKTHIAMTPDRLITAAVVTTGERHDGKELQTLIELSNSNEVEVKTVIGDGAYSEKENIVYSNNNNIELVSNIAKYYQNNNNRDDGFYLNKDAGMFVCPEGNLATRVAKHGTKSNNLKGTILYETYFFDILKCKSCKNKTCHIGQNQKSKSYSIIIKKDKIHEEHINNMEKESFKESYKERYKIEAKNAELKNRHGYSTTKSNGLLGMNIQAALSIFVVNIKRVISLIDEKKE
jgi:hypothetical protein